MSNLQCQYCLFNFKNETTFKGHLISSKRCLKLRGVKIETKYVCTGCNNIFMNKVNLHVHEDSCKEYILIKTSEKYDGIISNLKKQIEDASLQNTEMKINYDKQLESQQQQYLKQFETQQHQYLTQLESQQRQHDSKLIGVQTTFEKTIRDLQAQNDKLIDSLRQLASQAIDKPSTSTTNNVTNNTIKNHFSEKYFLETISMDDVKRKCQNYLTEEIFLQGQRGIAKLCTDHIIKTKDNKALMICTDASRKKFKYMDEQGNLKEDHEARAFTEKVSKPIKDVSKIVYENILSDVKYEKENVEETDYSRKAVLNDKELSAIDCFVKITCFDHPDHHNDYKNELAILNK